MISIIIPVYNAENFIDRTLMSIFHQTYTDWELILVEDCSNDSSLEKCQEWKKKDDRIYLIHNEKNYGQGEARNIGLKHAKGDYIFFCDADDYIELNYLETMLDEIEKHDVDIVCCDYWQYTWRADIHKYEKVLIYCECVDNEEILTITKRKDMPDFFPCVMWNKLYKRHVFENIKFLEEKVYFEDFYVNCLAMLYGYKFLYKHIPLYHYYASNEKGNNSNANIEKMAEDLKYVFKKLNKLFENEKDYEEYACSFMNHARKSLKYHLSKYDYMNKLLKEKRIEESINEYFSNTYTKYNNKSNIYCYGSFCLRQVMHLIPYSFMHISYMKIASAIKELPKEKVNYVVAENSFRTSILENDINLNIENIWNKKKDNSYIVIDLLDERFDTVLFNNRIITKNEFFEGFAQRNCIDYNVIRENDEDWEINCDKFVKLIKTIFDEDKIIIVKNRLSYGYGQYKLQRNFDNIDSIIKTNELISRKESFLLSKLPKSKVITIPEMLNFTFCRHSFGVYPYYHNYRWYRYVACEIEKILSGQI